MGDEMTLHLRIRIAWGHCTHWVSRIVPMPMTSNFISHVGVPYRVQWWQWHGRQFRKRGAPTGPRQPEYASPCSCHNADGVRIRPDHTEANHA